MVGHVSVGLDAALTGDDPTCDLCCNRAEVQRNASVAEWVPSFLNNCFCYIECVYQAIQKLQK